MIGVIVIFSIFFYCFFCGITAKVLGQFFEKEALLVGVFWPFALPFFFGHIMVHKIILRKEKIIGSKIKSLKQDLVIAKETRFKIDDEYDFEKAEKACSSWRMNNPLGNPNRQINTNRRRKNIEMYYSL